MKILVIIFTFLIVLNVSQVHAQSLIEYDSYDALSTEWSKDNDTTYIVNFWATWCAPCVKELPYFEAFNKKYADQKLKVILVSLDFKKQIKTHLIPFVNKNNIASKVVIMNDKKYNAWLPKVDKNWSGSIPATYVVKANNKLFAEREFTNLSELENFVFSFSNHK